MAAGLLNPRTHNNSDLPSLCRIQSAAEEDTRHSLGRKSRVEQSRAIHMPNTRVWAGQDIAGFAKLLPDYRKVVSSWPFLGCDLLAIGAVPFAAVLQQACGDTTRDHQILLLTYLHYIQIDALRLTAPYGLHERRTGYVYVCVPKSVRMHVARNAVH